MCLCLRDSPQYSDVDSDQFSQLSDEDDHDGSLGEDVGDRNYEGAAVPSRTASQRSQTAVPHEIKSSQLELTAEEAFERLAEDEEVCQN